MRIFKKEFSKELTKGMSIGECIITKVTDTQYGNFMVHRQTSKDNFTFLGCFPSLQYAIEHVITVEKPKEKFEYYLQYQKEDTERWNKAQMLVMGLRGWELCGIQPSENKDYIYIYKRKLPVDIKDDTLAEDLDITSRITYTEKSRLIPLETSENKITYKFGKNGQGLTDELIMLGEVVKELSKTHRVYLSDSFIDEVDDVYALTITLYNED